MPHESLTYQSIPPGKLKSYEIERMYQLMEENYNCVNYENFIHDLNKKQFVGLLRDTNNTIQGFTTFAINPAHSGGEDYHIIFSGDTIITRKHWGSMTLMKGWCETTASIMGTDPGKDWYWYLISKGHRTYMYLPLFFKAFYPSREPAPNTEVLKNILNHTSRLMFGKYWLPDKGIVRFDNSMGELKPELAEATFTKSKKKDIAFFLERNPYFYKGDELACIAKIHPDNLRGIVKRFFQWDIPHKTT